MFAAKKKIIGVIIIGVFLALLFPAGYATAATASYDEGIRFLQEKGAIDEGVFLGEALNSKAQFAVWLAESIDFQKENYVPETKDRFLDVPENRIYAPAVYYLVDLGVIRIPSSKKFSPGKIVRFSEVLKWSFFAYGVPAPRIIPDEEWPFRYLDKKTEFSAHLYKTYRLGLVTGDAKWYPTSTPTQGQVALFLKKLNETVSSNTITVRFTPSSSGNSRISQEGKFPILSDTYERVLNSYLHRDQIQTDDLVYGAIDGMVKSLNDKHSEFSKPDDTSVIQTLSGEIEGIGAVIQADETGNIIIVSPIKKSPAEEAGLLPNDIILEVNNESLAGLTATKAAEKIRGPAGTTVMLKIRRNGTTFEVSIVREKIRVVSAEIDFTEDNIGIITMNNFGSSLGGDFLKIVAQIADQKPRGLVLDLRNNPGGYLDAAIEVAGYFIEDGKTVSKVRYPNHMDSHVSRGTGVLAKYSIRTLINKGSASASEILAGALQDHGIGKVIGEKSFGKGTVQELTTYTDGSALKITVAEWLTPNERSIENTGIAPDIEIKRTLDDISNNRDPQMDRALSDIRSL